MKDKENPESITALNPSGMTPEVILNNCLQEAHRGDFEAVFVVAITKNGQSQLWASHRIDYLPLASVILQNMALKLINQEIKQ